VSVSAPRRRSWSLARVLQRPIVAAEHRGSTSARCERQRGEIALLATRHGIAQHGNGTMTAMESTLLKPRRTIRRFDVFAEYNRLRGLEKGLDAPHAKGYGLWVAKVVASGGGRRASGQREAPGDVEEGAGQREGRQEAPPEQEWHVLSGEPQTDVLFEREIVQRMGPDFYARVFAPAIAQAVHRGSSYESMRDTIRKDWTPTR
jgi:hypothetical protein